MIKSSYRVLLLAALLFFGIGTWSHYAKAVAPVISSITSNATSSGTLKIGNTIRFTLTPTSPTPGGFVSGLYNGIQLSWSSPDNGASYVGTYTVTEGDQDQTTPLQISNVFLFDSSLNASQPGSGSDIAKKIDANRPTIISASTSGSNTIDIVFSEDLNGASITNADFSVSGFVLDSEFDAYEISNGIVRLTLTSPFATDATPVITYSGSVTDTPAGNSATAPVTVTATDGIAPTVASGGIIGTTVQNGDDLISIDFSEPVLSVDGTWSPNEFTSIESPNNTAKLLTGASFSYNGTTLTITLAENNLDASTYLRNGNTVAITPASGAIRDISGNTIISSEIIGSVQITGDITSPTVTISYSPDQRLGWFQSVVITATFSEAIHEGTPPLISISTPGDGDLVATAMTEVSNTIWTYTWQTPGGLDDEGTATISISSADLSGNANETPTGNTRVIDTQPPIIYSVVAGTISSSSAVLTVETSESTTCKYASSNIAYSNMSQLESTGGTSHSHTVSSLSPGTFYTYYVKCQDASLFVSNSESASFTTAVDDTTAVLAITAINTTKSTATSGGGYSNGLEWIFEITVPTNESSVSLQFTDWTGTGGSITVADNMRIYSVQSSNAATEGSAITLASGGVYSFPLRLNSDLNSSVAGRQIRVVVQMKIPTGTIAGSYSTNYGVRSAAP